MTTLTDSALPTTEEAERLGRQVASIEAAWGELFPLHLKGHVRPFESQPYLFLAAFPRLVRQDADLVAIAGRLFLSSMLAFDEVIDRAVDPMKATTGTLRAQAMRFEAYHLLYQMFPPQAAFWKHFRGYLVDYSKAAMEERRFADGLRPWSAYTEEFALTLARGKNSVAQATVAALAERAGDDRYLAPLSASILHHYTAWQMWDDLCDWKIDLRAGVPSLLLTRVLDERPPEAEREALVKEMTREIYYGGHALYVLDLALHQLELADGAAAVVESLAWREVIARLRTECTSLREDVERIVRGNRKRVQGQPAFQLALPAPEDSWQELAWRALSFVVEQWQLGFGEARHIMHLTHSEGFSAKSEYHFGDVFQRALIADALCDANEVLGGALAPVVEHEARYLLSQCDSDTEIGGWRYFQTVAEVAPDADDLGQVMQVLLRTGLRGEVERTCEAPLAVLLEDRTHPDGSIETWIVPAENRTPEQERQLQFNREKWGTGPDNEVVANLLYALTLYDRERFADTILRGIAWLETRQEADGSWLSTWYYGPFYGTYVCLRLLKAARPARPESPAIALAERFLASTQRIDGGWGAGSESDPLSSALAVLGLCALGSPGGSGPDTPPAARLRRALAYFARLKAAKEPWPHVHFIKPRLNDPYGSRTMTASYLMKAALAAHEVMPA